MYMRWMKKEKEKEEKKRKKKAIGSRTEIGTGR